MKRRRNSLAIERGHELRSARRRSTTISAELDAFIEAEIAPLQARDDNDRFFDHRREWARTDLEHGGLPRTDWEALLAEAKQARRRGRPLPLRLAEGIRRQGRLATCGWR